MEEEGWRSPSPFQSWIFNTQSREWEAPIPMPSGDGLWVWNEETMSWEELTTE